jgi:hypothetical protein
MKRVLALMLFSVLATLLSAADLTGTWKGSFEAGANGRELTFDLKSAGDTVTGTVKGLLDHGLEVKDGKIDGDSVSFWIVTQWDGQDIKLVYTGKIAAGEIRFTMATADGAWSTEFVAKKS